MTQKMTPFQIPDVSILSGDPGQSFWGRFQDLVRETVLPYQWKALNDQLEDTPPSHAYSNFKIAAGEEEGEFFGMVFQDSDLYKWIEASSYSLMTKPDRDLETRLNTVGETIIKAQRPDGYLNTYYILKDPEGRWSNLRDNHELYCAGHFFEAAVAHHHATGSRVLLDTACRFADLIDKTFGYDEGKISGYPGHEEIELALIKLFRVTGEKRYLELAYFFLDHRGSGENYFEKEAMDRGETVPKGIGVYMTLGDSYAHIHAPVREQDTAEGHAVRAAYLYSGMADAAAEKGDTGLLDACRRIWQNITEKRMYITGGIGAEAHGESFSLDYDLPNDRAYAETCAAIGLVFWAHRMLQIEGKSEYADIMERCLYNGITSGISYEGSRFFYVNPLEVKPEECRRRYDLKHVKPERQKWYGCACCPPNLARLITSLGQYFYSYSNNTIWVHLYGSSTGTFNIEGNDIKITQSTNYPWKGNIRITLDSADGKLPELRLRIPGWCSSFTLNRDIGCAVEDGYAVIPAGTVENGEFLLDLEMPAVIVRSHPSVRYNAGKAAVTRGPLVYCAEEADNGSPLARITLDAAKPLSAEHAPDLFGGITVIRGEGISGESSRLYSPDAGTGTRETVTFVPYHLWGNRGTGEMAVWIPVTD
ncbi:MAG: glycoside hydrolase family 127 protein [Spirochaetia bacterium]